MYLSWDRTETRVLWKLLMHGRVSNWKFLGYCITNEKLISSKDVHGRLDCSQSDAHLRRIKPILDSKGSGQEGRS